MSIVIENPRSVRELLNLVGKPVVLGSFVYGVLAVNEKTEELTIMTPGYTDAFILDVDKVTTIEEITAYTAAYKWHLKESFELISTWSNHIDWTDYRSSDGWIKSHHDLVNPGELPRNDYTVNNGLKFL